MSEYDKTCLGQNSGEYTCQKFCVGFATGRRFWRVSVGATSRLFALWWPRWKHRRIGWFGHLFKVIVFNSIDGSNTTLWIVRQKSAHWSKNHLAQPLLTRFLEFVQRQSAHIQRTWINKALLILMHLLTSYCNSTPGFTRYHICQLFKQSYSDWKITVSYQNIED